MVGIKRLIFHLYVNENWKSNPIYWVHKYLLQNYSLIFDEALFIISVDDINDFSLIKEAENFLIDCNFKNIAFRVEKNNGLCEVETFDKYILERLDDLGGMTFFGHSKGTTNYYNPAHDKNAILDWVLLLYYLNLAFYKDAEWAFYTARSYFFGGPMLLENGKIHYSGTFYWLNGRRIFEKFNGKYPVIKDRFYAELFPSFCRPYDYDAYSHNYMMINKEKIKDNLFKSQDVSNKYIEALLSDDERASFYELKHNVIDFLTENGINY